MRDRLLPGDLIRVINVFGYHLWPLQSGNDHEVRRLVHGELGTLVCPGNDPITGSVQALFHGGSGPEIGWLHKNSFERASRR